MLEARCSLGQGSQWGIWPTKRRAVWEVSFVLVLYLGTFISGLRVFQERWGRFCSQGLDSWQFSLCRQLLLLPQGPEIAFSTRRWEQSGCKTVCICHSWSVEYSQQPPAGNEPKAVMQLLWGAPQLAKAKLQHLRIQTKQNEAGRFSCSLAARTFQPETLGATSDPSTASVFSVLLMVSFIFSTSCNCT